MDPIAEFWKIGGESAKKLGETFNAPDILPFGERLLRLIAQHPEKRSQFAQAFLESFEKPYDFDPLLIQFCMHALRWPEAREKFEALSREAISKNDWRRIPALQHLLDAFEDNWEDAQDFYAEYFKTKPPNI